MVEKRERRFEFKDSKTVVLSFGVDLVWVAGCAEWMENQSQKSMGYMWYVLADHQFFALGKSCIHNAVCVRHEYDSHFFGKYSMHFGATLSQHTESLWCYWRTQHTESPMEFVIVTVQGRLASTGFGDLTVSLLKRLTNLFHWLNLLSLFSDIFFYLTVYFEARSLINFCWQNLLPVSIYMSSNWKCYYICAALSLACSDNSSNHACTSEGLCHLIARKKNV